MMMVLYMNKEIPPFYSSLTSFTGSNCSEGLLISFPLGFSIIASVLDMSKIPM